MRRYDSKYDSLADMLDTCKAGLADGRDVNESNPITRSSFVGREFHNWDEVFTAVHSAWKEGLDAISGMLAELGAVAVPIPLSSKRRARFSDADGDEIDNDRLRGGQDYWRQMRRESCRSPRTFTLVADMSTSASVDSRQILWRGAAAIILADILEQAGNRVELYAARHDSHAYTNGAGLFSLVCLKHASDPVDTSALVNAISGWFLRTVFFQEQRAKTTTRPTEGLGRPTPFTAADPAIQEVAPDARVIAGVWSKDQAVSLIRKTLEEINA